MSVHLWQSEAKGGMRSRKPVHSMFAGASTAESPAAHLQSTDAIMSFRVVRLESGRGLATRMFYSPSRERKPRWLEAILFPPTYGTLRSLLFPAAVTVQRRRRRCSTNTDQASAPFISFCTYTNDHRTMNPVAARANWNRASLVAMRWDHVAFTLVRAIARVTWHTRYAVQYGSRRP